jgi:hypothetical protein
MIAKYNRISLWLGVPGIVLQMAGLFTGGAAEGAAGSPLGLLLLLVGTALLLAGLAYYAKAKGRHPAWCLVAFLSWIGLLILALLRDKARAS